MLYEKALLVKKPLCASLLKKPALTGSGCGQAPPGFSVHSYPIESGLIFYLVDYSINSCFILVKVTVDLEHIPGTLPTNSI